MNNRGVSLTKRTGPKIELPDSERGRGSNEIRRLDRLLARLARPDLTEKQREAAMRELHALEQAPREVSERAWNERTSAETAALARERGEQVEGGARRPLRVSSRDPLKSLMDAGKLSPAQHSTGTTIRGCYASRGAGLGSQLGGITGAGGGSSDNSAAIFYGIQRGKENQFVGSVERGILVGIYRNNRGGVVSLATFARFKGEKVDPHDSLRFLRGVCGEDKALSSYGEGRAFERNLNALRLALDIAQEVLKGLAPPRADDKPGMISLGQMNARECGDHIVKPAGEGE